MSERLLNNLRELSESMRENSASVETKISNAGTAPDRAVVASAAKYHDALKRLADE